MACLTLIRAAGNKKVTSTTNDTKQSTALSPNHPSIIYALRGQLTFLERKETQALIQWADRAIHVEHLHKNKTYFFQ